jgi:hypothetical protein
MDIFNAPTRETCTVQRERTNTPLQALVTMNDPQFVEASRQLAQAALKSAEEQFDRQLDYVTLRLLARRFGDRERQIAKQAYEDYLRYYESHADDAKSLLIAGASKPDMTLPLSESAALTMVASQIMNLDEALNK